MDENYKPISMWGYFGYEILFCLPCIGLILCIVFSFAPSNINVKNFARAHFCIYIIAIVLILLASILGIFSAATLANSMYY